MASGIVGYGVYIPWCRIKVADIAKAWGVAFEFPVEKTVPFYDEDSITMAVEASLDAIRHAGVEPTKIDAIFFGTTTNPYLEKQGSSTLASMIGTRNDAMLADFANSARCSTVALSACLDALNSGRINCGLVVGTDMLIGRPGEATDYLSSSGAGALVLGKGDLIAEIEGGSSYATDFTDTWRSEDMRLPMTTHPRFMRDYGYIPHVTSAVKGLMEKIRKGPDDFKFAAFSQPDPGYVMRAIRGIGISPDKVAQGMVSQFIGNPGSASVLIALAAILDKAKPGERVLMASYGEGVSDAFSILPIEKIEEKRQNIVEEYIERKKYVDYTTYLRWNRLLGRVK